MKAKLVALAVLSLAGCNKPQVVQAPPPTPLPIATPTPAPVVIAPPAPPPATPSRHLAAEGVFYLVTWVRVENADGITGLPPGTGVKIVKPGVYLTPAGEWPLLASQITNDLDIARQARDAGIAGQNVAKQRQAAEESKAVALEASVNRSAAANRNGDLTNLDRESLTRKLDALRNRKTVLQGQISAYSQAIGAENHGRAIGRIEAGSSVDNLAGVRAEITLVNGQISDAEAALRRLK